MASNDDRVSRQDVEERLFGRVRVTVSTHSGAIRVSGPHLDNFQMALAAEWVAYVLNGWDLKADMAAIRRALTAHNMKIQK